MQRLMCPPRVITVDINYFESFFSPILFSLSSPPLLVDLLSPSLFFPSPYSPSSSPPLFPLPRNWTMRRHLSLCIWSKLSHWAADLSDNLWRYDLLSSYWNFVHQMKMWMVWIRSLTTWLTQMLLLTIPMDSSSDNVGELWRKINHSFNCTTGSIVPFLGAIEGGISI